LALLPPFSRWLLILPFGWPKAFFPDLTAAAGDSLRKNDFSEACCHGPTEFSLKLLWSDCKAVEKAWGFLLAAQNYLPAFRDFLF